MKTASEISSLIMGQFVDSQEAVDLIKEYAKQISQQTLKQAAHIADIEWHDGRFGCRPSVNKETILNTEIKTP